jgi:hypothetical protein
MDIFFKPFAVTAHSPTSRRLTHGKSYIVVAELNSPHYLVVDDTGVEAPYNKNQFQEL